MSSTSVSAIPHPFPYQGSKRAIARYILPYIPQDVGCLFEPFCGAAAVSIAASAGGLVNQVVLNDLNQPLIALWEEILFRPGALCDEYERQWLEQQTDRKAYFYKVRAEFNKSQTPHLLLYLFARIVKGSVRYSAEGQFNQSADNRRSGMHPKTIRRNILGVSALLANKTKLTAVDFRQAITAANEGDLIYLDPPYQGTSFTRDHRYLNGLVYDEFVDALMQMNDLNLSYIISYDGYTGNKPHGKLLPDNLYLRHLLIRAGRSSQATLLGHNHETIESLYLSPALVRRLDMQQPSRFIRWPSLQSELALV